MSKRFRPSLLKYGVKKSSSDIMFWIIELFKNVIAWVVSPISNLYIRRRRLRLLVHRARFLITGQECYFINGTNLSHDRDLEITHIWFDCAPRVYILQNDRPLPVRLRPDESWETWIELEKLPDSIRQNPYTLARARLSNGYIVKSRRNLNVPEVGTVPGGPIRFT